MAITVSGTPAESAAAADPQSFSCTGSTTPRGAVVAIGHGTTSSDIVNGVTWGGVAMTRIRTNVDTATEAGRVYLYFIKGSAISGGAQTVSVDRTEATTTVHVVAFTLDANKDLEVIDDDGIDNNVANPSVTLNYGGRTALSVSVGYTGGASPFAAGTNCTLIHDNDFTAFGNTVQRQTTEGSSDFAIGHTAATDDVAFSAMAMAEVVVPAPFLTHPFHVGQRRYPPAKVSRRR